MNTGLKPEASTEPELIDEYATSTGSSKGTARNVLMHVCTHEDAYRAPVNGEALSVLRGPSPKLLPYIKAEDTYGAAHAARERIP